MGDYSIVNRKTPVVHAFRINETLAGIPGKPIIFHKKFDITEFIGERLADVTGVKTVHYFPLFFGRQSDFKRSCIKASNIRVGSVDFRQPDVTYKFALEFSSCNSDSFLDVLDMCLNDQNREQFIEENLKMMALDIYMYQVDRRQNVYYEFYPNGEIHLGPLFDYEWSLYSFNGYCYENDFFHFNSIEDYQEMIVKYPKFKGFLSRYLDICLDKEVEAMARERKFSIPNICIDEYKHFDEESHKRLQKILH